MAQSSVCNSVRVVNEKTAWGYCGTLHFFFYNPGPSLLLLSLMPRLPPLLLLAIVDVVYSILLALSFIIITMAGRSEGRDTNEGVVILQDDKAMNPVGFTSLR